MKAALNAKPDLLGSRARAKLGPNSLGRILPSSKATLGLTVVGYFPLIPELPNWIVKTRYAARPRTLLR